ncbi:MAG: peptidoglycan-binding domain-containing protein [Polyangiales bacterium]
MKTRPYVVRAGDYLTQLGHRHGFDPEVAWQHPKNAALRALRHDPELLAPGDVVHMPETARPAFDLAPGTSRRFKARRARVDVRVVLRVGDEALANEPFTIEGAGGPITGQTDDAGTLRASVPIDARLLRVKLLKRGSAFDLRLGELDPVTEETGQRQRLEHLGYLEHESGAPRADSVTARTRTRVAVEAFQRARGLPVTGDADEATQRALTEAHGS